MKNEVYLFHEMQEISIDLPILFQIMFLTYAFSCVDGMRLNIQNKYAFYIKLKLVIVFAGIVKYYM